MTYDRCPAMVKLTILRQKQGRGTGGIEEEDMVGIDAKVFCVVLTLGSELDVVGIPCSLTIGFTQGLTRGSEKEGDMSSLSTLFFGVHLSLPPSLSLSSHHPISSILTGSQGCPSSIGLMAVRTGVDSPPSYSGRRSCSHCSTAGTQAQGTLWERRSGKQDIDNNN
jgi:hypothetical protein